MIRFGTVGSPKGTPKSGSPAAIAYSNELGLNALQLGWVRSVRVTDETAAQIKQASEDNDVALSVHASYYINLNSQTEEKMQKSDERLLTACRLGYKSGATDIIFHPGSYHGKKPETVYPIIRDKLIEITGILKEEGVEVNLRPETMGKTAVFGTLEEVVGLSKEVERVEPCLDIAHLHARRTDGTFNSYDEFAAMFELVKSELGSDGLKNLHFHISGIEYGDKGEKNHLPLDDSDLKWREFMQALVDYEVSGYLMCESPIMEEDALKLQAVYSELAG